MSVIGIIEVMQTIVLGLAVSVFLGGLLSALVYLGYFEIWERARLQRQQVRAFFGDKWESFASLDPLFKSPLSFRLHYRQLCGQLMTRVNEEASDPERPRPVITLLADLAWGGTLVRGVGPPDTEALMNEALRAVDQLQLRLATAINRTVLQCVFLVWAVLYVVILGLTAVYGDWPAHASAATSWYGDVIRFVLTLVLILVASTCVAAATAATAVVAFSWIDRVVSAR